MNRNGFRTTSRVLLEFAWSLVLDVLHFDGKCAVGYMSLKFRE